MKVLFIGEYKYFENLPFMYLSGFLKRNGYECHYIDIKLCTNLIKEVIAINPTIIGFSVLTINYKKYLSINRKIKEKFDFFSLFGGLHCTMSPEIINEKGVNAICMGEGEFPLLELVKALESGGDYRDIKNLWVKVDGIIYKNDLRNLENDIDSVCFPDRSVFDKYLLYRKLQSRIVVAGRGCPHSCTYCYNNQIKKIYKDKGKYVRIRNVESVIAELKFIKEKYKPQKIKLFDDSFIQNKEWGLKFCELYEKEINIPFIAIIRLNYFDETIIKAMKNAGCISVSFGIECGDETYRNSILKRNMSDNDMISVCLLFKKYKIKTNGLNMLGLPGEDLQSCIKTLKFNIKCKVSFAHAVMFTPLPETELTHYAIEKGYFDGNFKDMNFNNMFNRGLMNMKDIRKIKRLQYLFSITVAFPFILPVVKKIILLPFSKLYQPVFFLHRVYNHAFISKQLDLRDLIVLYYLKAITIFKKIK